MSASQQSPQENQREGLRQIGKYELVRKLGAGGMGTVYLAQDVDLKRVVALKVLPRERATNPTLVRRFKSEGQAAALLHHKNIVSVYEAGEAQGYLFLALEYVEGVDLLEWVNRRGPVPIKRSVEIIRQAAEALQHAYQRNIVHRDIKPSNLMISKKGDVKLTDMGLARSIDDTLDTTITRDGTTVGTVDYMAPEQASNSKAADIRSDIYSLGCTWYHLLTGSPPYPNGSVTNKITAHVSAPLPDPRVLNAGVPEALIAVLHRMMEKKKENRYQTPNDLLEELNGNVLKQIQAGPDLLAMFADDIDLKESDAGITALKLDGPPSTDFIVTKPQGKKTGSTQPTVERQKLSRERSVRTESTRVDIPVKPTRARRELLIRIGSEGDDKSNVPWGIILLAVIVISLTLIARYVIFAFFVNETAYDDQYSPYSNSAATAPR